MKTNLWLKCTTMMFLLSCANPSLQYGDASNAVSSHEIQESCLVNIHTSDSLTTYNITPYRLDLVCGDRPSESDEDIVLCVAGTWTGECLDEFSHANIASDHVSGGVYSHGYDEPRNTGCFVWYDKQFHFVYGSGNHLKALDVAAEKKGMGFCQEMMIHEGRRVPTKRPDENINLFRALCQKDSSLYVIDAVQAEPFGTFIQQLLNVGVTEALYLDMGPGWNYSWYRASNGKVHYIHDEKLEYSTNWIVAVK